MTVADCGLRVTIGNSKLDTGNLDTRFRVKRNGKNTSHSTFYIRNLEFCPNRRVHCLPLNLAPYTLNHFSKMIDIGKDRL
jgi:hypothetical protein